MSVFLIVLNSIHRGGGGLHRQCKVRVYVVLVARACFLAPTLFLFCFQVLVCLFMRNDL